MSSIDQLIDPKVAKDSTSVDRNLGSEFLSLVPDDCRRVTQKVITFIPQMIHTSTKPTVDTIAKCTESGWPSLVLHSNAVIWQLH